MNRQIVLVARVFQYSIIFRLNALKFQKYPLAIMEVCECNLGRFPQMQAFVHNDMAAAWGGRVKVRHVRGVRPTIILKVDFNIQRFTHYFSYKELFITKSYIKLMFQDANGVPRQTLNVEKWDTDTLTGYVFLLGIMILKNYMMRWQVHQFMNLMNRFR